MAYFNFDLYVVSENRELVSRPVGTWKVELCTGSMTGLGTKQDQRPTASPRPIAARYVGSCCRLLPGTYLSLPRATLHVAATHTPNAGCAHAARSGCPYVKKQSPASRGSCPGCSAAGRPSSDTLNVAPARLPGSPPIVGAGLGWRARLSRLS